jgi:hypothetical protein
LSKLTNPIRNPQTTPKNRQSTHRKPHQTQ